MRYIFFYLLLIVICQSTSAQNGTVKDIDGNVYKTVKIGSQMWMAENLKTSSYRDGAPIPELEDESFGAKPYVSKEAAWAAWYYYDNNAENNPIYGKLYNWYAVVNPRHLCPTGWHVPSDTEWTILTDYLDGDAVAGGKMKDTTLWNAPNEGADNSSGFTALPGGSRHSGGSFDGLGYFGSFWSTTESYNHDGWFWYLYSKSSLVFRHDGEKETGFSIRCVGD